MDISKLAVLIEEAAQKIQASLRDQGVSKNGTLTRNTRDRRLSSKIDKRRSVVIAKAEESDKRNSRARSSTIASIAESVAESMKQNISSRVARRRASTIESLLGSVDGYSESNAIERAALLVEEEEQEEESEDENSASQRAGALEKDELRTSARNRRPPVLNNQDVWNAISSFFHRRPSEQVEVNGKIDKRKSLADNRNKVSRHSKRRSSALRPTVSAADVLVTDKTLSSPGRPKYATLRPMRKLEEGGLFNRKSEDFEHEGDIRASGTIFIQRSNALGSWAQVYYNLWNTGIELYRDQMDCEGQQNVLFTLNFRDLVLPTGQVAERLTVNSGWGSKNKHVFLLHTEGDTFAFAASTLEERDTLLDQLDVAYAEYLERQIRKKAMMQLAWEVSENPSQFFAATKREIEAGLVTENPRTHSGSTSLPLATQAQGPVKHGASTKRASVSGRNNSSQRSRTLVPARGKGRSPSYVPPPKEIRSSRRLFKTAQPRQLASMLVDIESAHGVVDEMMLALESKMERDVLHLWTRRQMHRILFAWRAVARHSKSDRRARELIE